MKTANNWKDWVCSRRSDLAKVAAWDVFSTWKKNRAPETTADRTMTSGAECLFGGELELADRFFQQTRGVVDRAFSEGRVVPKSSPLFPLNRARLLRARGYANALSGKGDPIEDFRSAAADFTVVSEACKGDRRALQDRILYRLAAVRLWLIVGDGATAKHVLKLGRSDYHQQEQALWDTLLDDWARDERVKPATRKLLEAFYEEIRGPFAPFNEMELNEPVVLRLDVAAIRNRYLRNSGMTIQWPTVGSLK